MKPPTVIPKDPAGSHADPLAAYVEPYFTLVQREGYRASTVRSHSQFIASFSRWLVRTHRNLRHVDEDVLRSFLRFRFNNKPPTNGAPHVLRRLLGLIRDAGAAAGETSAVPSPADSLIGSYRRYLLAELGLAPSTVAGYEWHIGKFLRGRFGSGPMNLHRLQLLDAIRFIRKVGGESGPRHTQLLVAALRSFFRFLFHRSEIQNDLAPSIPNVPHWTLASLPKYLSSDAVQRVLSRCDRGTSLGRRNFAILLLLARLGLRGGEVLRLNLEDIDWESAQITIRATKGAGWARLPLPADAAKAIADYLRRDRPPCSSRRMFLRARAPYTEITTTSAIIFAVHRALKRADVTAPRIGAHLFRHSLATGMLRQGASLEEIGQLLRHRSPNTTAVYAKVDLNTLRPLALAWPGGVR
jgi:site-specific recombinase XerD